MSAITVAFLITFALLIVCSINYAVANFTYSYETSREHGEGLCLPTYPAFIPYFGSTASLLWDTAGFVRRAAVQKGKLTSVAVNFMGFKLYLFQDRETIGKFMRHPDLCSPMSLYIYALKHFFGMPHKALSVYLADDSGPHRRPLPGTNVNFRIDYELHQSFARAWSGPGLINTTQRFRRAFQSRIDGLSVIPATSWLHVSDFLQFFQKITSASMTEAIFGSALLQLNPGFIDDLWVYDSGLPWMARGIPSFLMPGPYRVRDRLRAQIKIWQAYTRDSRRRYDGSTDDENSSASDVVRCLEELFTNAQTHDEEALSAHNLAMIFAANFNLVPSALVAALHIICVPGLMQLVREEISANFAEGSVGDVKNIEPKKILELPLLSSIYAESLRLHVKIFFFASSPRSDASMGKWKLPRGTLGLVNTDGPHTEEDFWNTQNGRYPLDSFWAERFIVDPQDPSSGPLHPRLRSQKQDENKMISHSGNSSKHFTTEGIGDSWIPYGGGPAICPGRFLTRYVVMFLCAALVSEFDIEPIGQPNIQELDLWRYGLGVLRPKSPVPVRIRRRN
ncbi:cytochrome P450 [Xylaria curta]|nr:cytochrome P450 [Xylaria curta]